MTTITIDQTFRPQSWDQYVGQDELKDRLGVAINSAAKSNRRLDHILLDAPPGSGKSTIATLIAERMDVPMITVPQGADVKKVLRYLFELELGGIIFFDELHTPCTSPAMQLRLLALCEGQTFEDFRFDYVTVIGGTTERHKLPAPLVDRFIAPRFAPYTIGQMAEIVAGFADRVGIQVRPGDCLKYAEAAGGTPRVARSCIMTVRDFIEDGRPIDADAVLRFCQRHPDGLSYEQTDYLQALHDNGGRAGIDVLSTRLRQHRSVVQELERILLDRKLVSLDPTGRILTHAGHERLRESKKEAQ